MMVGTQAEQEAAVHPPEELPGLCLQLPNQWCKQIVLSLVVMLVHIRNMETVTMAGGIICPATPSFYSRPQTIEQVAATVVDRVLDLAGFDIKTFRWGKQ